MNPARRLADVIEFPLSTAGVVDDFGRDRELVERAVLLGRLRWDVSVGGLEHLPKRTGALIVVNSRRFALSPVLAALAISTACGRPVRFVGRPDTAPFGPLLQRLGGLLPLEPEIRGALRAGALVVLGAAPSTTNATTGVVDHRLVGAAVATRSWVVPAATISMPTRRAARVEIGPAERSPRSRRGPLAELELADRVRSRVDALLQESGGRTTPLDWFALDWLPLDTVRGR